jgi:bidirectional [NiFe] hydrogenase diaphorase subunit
MSPETIAPTPSRVSRTPQDYPTCDRRFKTIDRAIKRSNYRQDALIEVLHQAQDIFGYLDDEVLIYIARQMKLPLSVIYGVATFYHLFSLKPKGKHNCVVCLGTACYVKGSGEIQTQLEKYLEIKAGETTPDNQISLLTARCFGACGIAPAITLDGTVFGQETSEGVLEKVKALIKKQE